MFGFKSGLYITGTILDKLWFFGCLFLLVCTCRSEFFGVWIFWVLLKLLSFSFFSVLSIFFNDFKTFILSFRLVAGVKSGCSVLSVSVNVLGCFNCSFLQAFKIKSEFSFCMVFRVSLHKFDSSSCLPLFVCVIDCELFSFWTSPCSSKKFDFSVVSFDFWFLDFSVSTSLSTKALFCISWISGILDKSKVSKFSFSTKFWGSEFSTFCVSSPNKSDFLIFSILANFGCSVSQMCSVNSFLFNFIISWREFNFSSFLILSILSCLSTFSSLYSSLTSLVKSGISILVTLVNTSAKLWFSSWLILWVWLNNSSFFWISVISFFNLELSLISNLSISFNASNFSRFWSWQTSSAMSVFLIISTSGTVLGKLKISIFLTSGCLSSKSKSPSCWTLQSLSVKFSFSAFKIFFLSISTKENSGLTNFSILLFSLL